MSENDVQEGVLLALVIEDNDAALKSTVDLLEAHDITALGAKTAEKAISELKGAPSFHLILSDINLDTSKRQDRSGLSLAKIVRTRNPTIPIIGYSSALAEEEIGPIEPGIFTELFAKGKFGAAEISLHVAGWKKSAEEYRIARVESARERLQVLREKYPVNQSEFSTLRFLVPQRLGTSFQDGEADEVLRRAGYRLRLIERGAGRPQINEQSARLLAPLMFWLKTTDDTCIAEVMGYPELYGYGSDEVEAIRNVLLLMDGFHQDLAISNMQNSPTTERLRELLKVVFG